ERESVLREGLGSHQGSSHGATEGAHCETESDPPGLGAVPPTGGSQGHVQQTGFADSLAAGSLGATPASAEIARLVLPEVLARAGRALRLCRRHPRNGWNMANGSTESACGHGHYPPPEDQG